MWSLNEHLKLFVCYWKCSTDQLSAEWVRSIVIKLQRSSNTFHSLFSDDLCNSLNYEVVNRLSDLHNYDVSTENLVTFLLVYFPLHLVGWESDRLVIFARLHFNWNLSRVREREICVWATHFTCHKYLSRDGCGDTFDQHPTVIAWIVDAVKLIYTFVQHVNFLCDR